LCYDEGKEEENMYISFKDEPPKCKNCESSLVECGHCPSCGELNNWFRIIDETNGGHWDYKGGEERI
jgi:hypothetical protein